MTIGAALHEASARLEPVSDSPRLDAELLLAHVLEQTRVYLMTWPERELTESQQLAFELLLQQRQQGQPIAYLIGQAGFWSLPLAVNQHTLIPRPDTETLVERALQLIPADVHWRIADLGTGSGAIAIAIAHERPNCQVYAVDHSAEALAVAQHNAIKLKLNNIEFIEGSWLEPLTGPFEMVLSNPPYIDADDPHLDQGDVRFEPRSALVAGEHGLADLRTIIEQARVQLAEPAILLLEHGFEQADAVRNLLKCNGYTQICSHRDLAGHERVTEGHYPPTA